MTVDATTTLQDRTVLLTGVSRGIGAATARVLADRGNGPIDAFVEAMQAELNLTEAEARCFGEEFLSIDGLDLPDIAANPDTAMANPALLNSVMEILEECGIDPASGSKVMEASVAPVP